MQKKKGVLCPKVQQKLEVEKELAATCTVLPSSPTIFQVQHGIDDLTVDLDGIPCCHCVAALFSIHAKPEEYVHRYYHKETYLSAYKVSIPPCPGERHWPKVALPLNPPPIKVGPGRPRKSRRKDPFEDPKRSGKLTRQGVEMSCSICKLKTHNKRKCPDKNNVREPPTKRGRGRPRHASSSATTTSSATTVASQAHHDITAQPTRVGRGDRVIRTGRGAASGATARGFARESARGSARRGGRGSTRRAPIGMRVLFDVEGNIFTNDAGNESGPRSLVSVEAHATTNLATQASVNN